MTCELLLATANPHKVEELRGIFSTLGVRVLALNDVPPPPGGFVEPEETGQTFEANAMIKALAYARAASRTCLADDSGLQVDALDGLPGVDSAYYAGREGSRAERDIRNNTKLIDALKNVPDPQRTARYVCCICIATPKGRIIAQSRGTFEGGIAHAPRGTNGFGYDPLFLLPDGRTAAELSDHEKNARSHRASAARAVLPIITQAMSREVTI